MLNTNLIQLKLNNIQLTGAVKNSSNQTPDAVPYIPQTKKSSNLLSAYLNNQAVINTPVVTKAEKINTVDDKKSVKKMLYTNDLKTLFKNCDAKILAIIPRIFNAKDLNGNDYIDGNEEHGTFKNAIERLDEIKDDGYNCLHILPINTPGKIQAMGTAGSVYSPLDLLQIDPMLADKNDPRDVKEQFRDFINECHKRDIKVMIDLPSCASTEMFKAHPELMAIEEGGMAKTPQGWNDIRMFQPWEDEAKRTLNPKLLELHKQFVDMCIDLGVDGIRADVARAKPVEFWDVLIKYSRLRDPEFAWLAETYTHEDASPMINMPADRPDDSLRAGFDSFYGQYHLFSEWKTATEFMDYMKENLDLTYRVDQGKSAIASFASHDDLSPMFHGGADFCKMIYGLEATMPMTNMYAVDGFQTGDYYTRKYKDKDNPESQTWEYSEDNPDELVKKTKMELHYGKLDLFNLSRKPGGEEPSIRPFVKNCHALRDKYSDIVGPKGTLIELDKEGDKNDQIIAYARHYQGKTLLTVANKNVNRAVACTIKIPTLKANQKLDNLLPSYGQESIFQAADNELHVDIGASRVHVFEIDTPNIENFTDKVYRQR
ncbi:MAG: hypothetical protein VZR09_01040 [Candidatus Gastranaerophilaceae bacterium]|nr:hypothetical protein [Candidatus Gastranaerophilaceae bacterium]